MKNPCDRCRENDRCRKDDTVDECSKKRAFRRYKAKCREIAANTERIMALAKEKANENQGLNT